MKAMQQQLERYMDRWSDADRFCGSVVIAQGDRVLLRKGYGYANYEYRIPNEASTIYPIASVTKQFTAAAILQLVDAGKLRLEDPLKDYVPAYRYAERLTLHHLMSSTSGIPDYTGLAKYNPRERLSAERILEWLDDEPLQFEPGQGVEKSNSNFVLLAKVVEAVSGMDIEAYY
ncbi:serine hydrolase domain-containing protein [Gorillibacterium sp. sgz500922]|uniref:serine hydrolase domain-containing protein n=1 Tax=Gorillibacterium sp. sgz500922 TaxID=3446694 RepID=UPI003F67EF2C